jgi:tellurite methyltransferase
MQTPADDSGRFEAPWWLTSWAPQAPAGRALDLGAGDGALAAWLVAAGFRVDAVERDLDRWQVLADRVRDDRLRAIQANLLEIPLPPSHYALIVAASIFHFLRPSEFDRLAGDLARALLPGGLLMAEVFTTDDPGWDDLARAGVSRAGPSDFRLDGGAWLHYFRPGELRDAFPDLELLHYEESRRRDPDREAGYYSAATMVARAPLGA